MTLIIVKAQVASEVKKVSKEKKLDIDNVTSEFNSALDQKVRRLVEEAVIRASHNKRKTLMARDL